MKAVCFLFLATGAILAADGPGKDNASKGDLDKLRGTWLTVSLVNNGQTLADEKTPAKVVPPKLAYEGNKWMIIVGDKTIATGIFTIDATKKPKEIDILDDSGTKNDKTKIGIYEIDGDTFKYCLAAAGKPRPKDFTSKEGSGHSLGVMKREKP
jgi:uncharacterized protein (TIGR03067 family)